MASRAGQPGGVWVPSARDRACGFECSSVGWGPVAVERNGEGGQEPWPRGEAGLERWGPPGGKGGGRSCFLSGLATRSDRLVAASAEEQEVPERLGGCGSAPSGRTRPPGVREIPRARLAACGACWGRPSCCSWAASLCASSPCSSQQLPEASDPSSARPRLGPCV